MENTQVLLDKTNLEQQKAFDLVACMLRLHFDIARQCPIIIQIIFADRKDRRIQKRIERKCRPSDPALNGDLAQAQHTHCDEPRQETPSDILKFDRKWNM